MAKFLKLLSDSRSKSMQNFTSDQLEIITSWKAIDCAILDGRIFAVIQLAFTEAIITDIDHFFYSKRFCFDKKGVASQELNKWLQRGFNDTYPKNWIACRGFTPKELKEGFEENYCLDFRDDALKVCEYPSYPKVEEKKILCDLYRIDRDEADHKFAYLYYTRQI